MPADNPITHDPRRLLGQRAFRMDWTARLLVQRGHGRLLYDLPILIPARNEPPMVLRQEA